jgi:hypothetical protein
LSVKLVPTYNEVFYFSNAMTCISFIGELKWAERAFSKRMNKNAENSRKDTGKPTVKLPFNK